MTVEARSSWIHRIFRLAFPSLSLKRRNSLCCILQNWKLKYHGFMQKMRWIISIDTMHWNFGGSEKESFYLLLFFTNDDLNNWAIYRFKVADCDQLNFNFDYSTFNFAFHNLILPLHGVHTNLIEPAIRITTCQIWYGSS